MKIDVTVEEAESLLKTEYNVYSHVTTGEDRLAAEEYSLPAHVQEHVDFITPTVHFDAIVKLKAKRAEHSLKVKPTPQLVPDPLRTPLSEVTFNLTNCDRYITPECLRALYGLQNGSLAL
jgi:tripeptidyl-peptidase-1